MRMTIGLLSLLLVAAAWAAPGNLADERRTFRHRHVERDAYGSQDIQEIADRVRDEFNAASGTNYRSGTYSNQYQGACPGCTTSISSRVSHSSNHGSQKTQDELDQIARDMAHRMLDDVRTGKLHQSQISHNPNWFEQKAAQHLATMPAAAAAMRNSQTQSQYMSSMGSREGGGSAYQQQQQQQSMWDRDVEQIDSQRRQRPVYVASSRPVVSSQSHHSIYDAVYEERVPNYRGRVVYPVSNYEDVDMEDDRQVHESFDQQHPIAIRPGTGTVRVNFTVSTYNKTHHSHPGAGTTHVLTFNRNFTDADKREQIQSIIEEITQMNRTQLHGMDDIISQLVIQLDENSSNTDRQHVQDQIFRLIENIRNQYGAASHQSQGRVTEVDLLYSAVQELVSNFGTLMTNQSQVQRTNCLSTYIKSVQHTLTYEEKQTQAIVIQQEISRLTEEIRIWTNAQYVSEQQRQATIVALQEEIRQLQEILRQWNVPSSGATSNDQVSTHIIRIQNQLSGEEKRRQSEMIQTEIDRLRQEMHRWQQQTDINEQHRHQQVNGLYKEISTLSQIIEDWKQHQQTMVPQNQLSTQIITIENNLTEEEKDYQTQVIQDEIQRLGQEMESYSQQSHVNDRRRQEQIMECRQEISKLTEIIDDWKASKPTLTPQNQLSTHIIRIENSLTEHDKTYQSQLIRTEIERLREELERWKQLQHVNENKRQEQVTLIHNEISTLSQIVEEWRNKPAFTPENQLSTHIVEIESTLTEEEKDRQTVLVTTEIDRLREELERWQHLQNVNEEKRQQQVQMIRQEITKLSEIIQEWKETKATIVPGNQLSTQIITIEKTFTEEDRRRQNSVVMNEINRLREELQRWSHLQNVNEQKRHEQIRLIKMEISKLTEIVEEWKEVSKPVIDHTNKLSQHYITIENSLTEEEKVTQSTVVEQEITRLKEELEKWRQLQHVNEQQRQQQILEIRQEISKLTEIIQDWREHKPTLTAQNLLSTHVIEIESNLSEGDKEHQSVVIQEEVDRLRQELHRWSQMHNVNEQKRQQQIQLIRQEISKLTTIVEEWKATKSVITPHNQLSVQIITQENSYTEEEKVQKTAQIQQEIERLRHELHRWSQMQHVGEQKRQQQIQMIRSEISKLTEIIDQWRDSQVVLKPGSQMSLHIISIESTLSESDRARQVPQIRQEIQRLQQELEKWNRMTHVNSQKKQQQIYIIWEEIAALKRILEEFTTAQQPHSGDGSLISSHMIAIEKNLTVEEKLLQTVVIKEEIARLRDELDRFMKDTNNPKRQKEILWIRREIEKLNEILRNWQLTETPNNKGRLSVHILSIEHTLSDDQKLHQTVIIKEELVRLQQELERWQKNRGDRQERERNIFYIRQEMNKLNEILSGWKVQYQIGTGGLLSTHYLSIQSSLTSDQKEREAVKIRDEITRLRNERDRWMIAYGHTGETRQVTAMENEMTLLQQILDDWALEKLSPDFSKLSTHILHIDHTMTDQERGRNEEIIRKEIYRLNQVLEEWTSRKNANEEDRHRVVLLVQKEIDLLKSILDEWQRRTAQKGLLSAFIRSIASNLSEEQKYYYSLLIIQEIVRLQRESAKWRAAHENQENQCWYINEKNNNISFDQEKQRQLKMIREEVERLVQILKEWEWRRLSSHRMVHQIFTPEYVATTKQPGVFIYDKQGTNTGLAKSPQKLINKNRGDQPPHQFEEDYISEEELEPEPEIVLYPSAQVVLSTTARPRPTLPQLPPVQQTVEVFPTQREYRRREYQKTTITTSNNAAVMPQFHMSASASAGGNTQQRQIPMWASNPSVVEDSNFDGLESMSQQRPMDGLMQQTQPVFEEEETQQRVVSPFEDMHFGNEQQKVTHAPKKPALEVEEVTATVAEIAAPTTGKPGFWQQARNIFG